MEATDMCVTIMKSVDSVREDVRLNGSVRGVPESAGGPGSIRVVSLYCRMVIISMNLRLCNILPMI